MTERERLIELLCKAPLGGYPFEKQYYKSAITKFADYLLDNGVTILPCKVGDEVYQIDNGGKIYGSKVRRIIYEMPHIGFDDTAIGKSVFLNYDEAVAKAKEREEK